MHNYIACIICCAGFTSVRLLAIHELWIDGYDKPILINVNSDLIVIYGRYSHTLNTSVINILLTLHIYQEMSVIPVVFNYLLLIPVCSYISVIFLFIYIVLILIILIIMVLLNRYFHIKPVLCPRQSYWVEVSCIGPRQRRGSIQLIESPYYCTRR
jgi:hypothetical protein